MLLKLRTEMLFERERKGTYLWRIVENLSVLTKPRLQMVSHPYSNGVNSTWRIGGEDPMAMQLFILNHQHHTRELTVFQTSLANRGFSPAKMHNK